MTLRLVEMNFTNDGPETYRLIIKEGNKIVGEGSADPGVSGNLYIAPPGIPIAGPLTLIADKI